MLTLYRMENEGNVLLVRIQTLGIVEPRVLQDFFCQQSPGLLLRNVI